MTGHFNMKLSGWGRYPVLEAPAHRPRSEDALRSLVQSEPNLIACGNGRAYGDSAINTSATIQTRHLNRMLAFNEGNGQLVAQAGVLLGDIIDVILPRGWFPLVSPRTKFVTLGGAIAADMHGKNHHKDGSFRACVDWVDIIGPNGEVHRCSTRENPSMFDYTLGGMGLTGIILRAALRLRPVQTAWIRQTTIAAPDLKAAMAVFDEAEDATYSVAWIYCLGTGHSLGRSLVMLGEHAARDDLPAAQAHTPFRIEPKRKHTVPNDFPAFALKSLTVRAFNALYCWAGARKSGVQLVDWNSYFYSFDTILGWNRIYGRKSFDHFQCVLLLDRSKTGLTALLEETAKAGTGSFLAVLKRFGEQYSVISFLMEGYTLALYFPVTSKTLALMERLDQITIDHGDRFYLAKDIRMGAATLRASDNRAAHFRAHCDSHSFTSRLRSA